MSQRLKRVLLIDDDEINNLLHKRLLLQSDLIEAVDVVTEGEDALTYLAQSRVSGIAPPEMIFLDINMPRMTGFEFLESYATLTDMDRRPRLVVMLTTSLLLADRQRAEADPNVDEFVNKPLTEAEIRRLVAAYWAKST